ncbi:DoxX family protein [Streptomyces sp. P6-2-1]|uniref:DoxX family protein n=1 Tax=Streptomyces sp. P6-2-1 TaxID=3422591 RepID=UPI003D35B55D
MEWPQHAHPAPLAPLLALSALALVQLVDAVLCLRPVGFVRDCLTDVGLPRPWWRLLPVVKTASAAGLVAGIWWRPLAVVTSAALVLYFLLAIGAHVRARDFGRNLFLNASGMLVLCAATLVSTLTA